MSFLSRYAALALVCLASSPALAERTPIPSRVVADKVLLGNIHTSARAPAAVEATALAIKDGKIIAVGSELQLRLRGYVGPNTQVDDQRGQTVVPGFVGAHDHILKPLNPDTQLCPVFSAPGQLDTDPSYSEALTAAAFCAANYFPPGAPMALFVGPEFLASGHGLNARADFTVAAPLNPLFMFQVREGHGGTANGPAFDAVGMSTGPGSPDYYSGYLGRMPDDSPDGHVQEMQQIPFFRMLASLVPVEAKREEYRVWLNTALSQGYVYALNIPFDGYAGETVPLGDSIQHPVELDTACLPLSATETCTPHPRQGRVRWVKAFADGAIAACGGATDLPYVDSTQCPSVGPGWKGRLDLSRQQLEARMRSVMATPDQCLMVHAWGRRAARTVAEVAVSLWLETGRKPCLTLEHGAMTDAATRAMLLLVGAGIVVNPQHMDFLDIMALRHDPRELADAERFRSFVEAGFVMGVGADTFASPEAPLKQIHRMVTQARPEERLTVRQAVEAITRGSAEARRLRNLGTLEVGKDASYVVLSHNIFSGNLQDLEQATVLKTVIKGELGVPVPPPAP
ncbi:hypothetical protein D7V97_07410 [Corallococcus sp. CA053C]|uniref:amidohydrolase family protein n=1 Tax=Corallococcus sp. CA053C TaxID=2316732 RepID=UPI000EA32C38|nr:amidohydrolase family protein [Corallococcus sp. CA053C]RKH12788.1 hypothetical protein D7V97_07410 [Corallococcus sp. CA053C]